MKKIETDGRSLTFVCMEMASEVILKIDCRSYAA